MELLAPNKFVSFLRNYEIFINEQTLESFEKSGLLQPVLRVNIPKEHQKSLFLPTIADMKWYFKNKLIEFPKKRDYQSWDNFKPNYNKIKNVTGSRLLFYHPFQLFQIENILRLEKFSFIYYDYYDDLDLDQIIKNIKKQKTVNKKFRYTNFRNQIRNIGLLMLLEEPYRYFAFGTTSFSATYGESLFENWIKWKNTKLNAKKLLKESRFTVKEVQNLYDYFSREGIRKDPIASLYDLTRIMRNSMLKQLRGNALKSQLYYSVSRLLSNFLYDLTGETMDEPDVLVDERGGKWKKDIISNPFDYLTKKTQDGII